MSTEFFNDQWRIPSNENQNKVSNYSCEFDGSNDFITISNPTELTDDFTISAWIFPTRVDSSYEMIYTQGDGTVPFYFSVEDTKLHVYITGIYRTGLNFITANEWQHVAVTRTSGVLNLYRNGVEYNGTRPTQNGTINNNSAGIIGKWYNSSNYFKGKIDQTCIFDYALPATGTNSIATLYGGGTAVVNPLSLSPKPIAAYQLGDQSVDNGANYLVPNNSLKDYVFNFDTDRINIANGSTIARQQNISYSAWINATSLSITQYVVGNNSSSNKGTSIFLLNDVLVFQFGDYPNFNNQSYFDSRVSNLSNYVNANEWFHVAASWDGTDSKIYINGIERNSWTPTQPPTYTISGWSNNFIIGRRADTTSSSFYGKLSNIAFWNSGLTASQVETLYNNGAPNDISSLNPVSWWKLNAADTFDGSNWTIKDYGSGDNDGTSFGMDSSNLVQSDLQHTSGYSPYALDFGGVTAHLKTNTIPVATNTVTLSAWVKRTGATGNYGGVFGIRNTGGTPGFGLCWQLSFLSNSNKIQMRISEAVGGTYKTVTQDTAMIDNTWTHVVGVADGTNIYLYINGILQSDTTTYNGNLLAPTSNIYFAAQGPTGTFNPFAGQLSNCARWNVGLTQAQITEIYNQGVPSNLNTFSGTAPIGWWQLGSNSSFEGNNWTCLDEIGTDNADSGATAMLNNDIINGPGYSANGLGESTIDIVGDAPYSSGNGLSENMDVLDRVKDTPPT